MYRLIRVVREMAIRRQLSSLSHGIPTGMGMGLEKEWESLNFFAGPSDRGGLNTRVNGSF